MKRILACILALILVFSLAACGDKDDDYDKKSDSSSTSDKWKPSIKDIITNHQDDIEFVLDRKIYVFKNDFPEYYTYDMIGFVDMDKTLAYVENWDFSQVLNNENYKDINWEIDTLEGGARIVTFTGKAKMTGYTETAVFNFYIQEGANIPLVTSIWMGPSEDVAKAGPALGYPIENEDIETAVYTNDAKFSCMISLYSGLAVTTAPEYYVDPSVYEAKADEAMVKGDYDSAIKYYRKALIYGDKLSAAFYAKAEECLASGDLDGAYSYFDKAGDYKDAAVRASEIWNADQQNTPDKDEHEPIITDAFAILDFCNMANGIWVDKSTCEVLDYGDVMFSFCVFEDGGLCFGDYPGSYGRVGKIVNVEEISNREYNVTLFYQEEEYFGDVYEASYEDGKLFFDDDSLQFENSDIVYTYMGKDLENAKQSVSDYLTNYSASVTPEPNSSITKENFESVVDLAIRENWREIGIFPAFYKEVYTDQNECSYSYIGTTYSTFDLPILEQSDSIGFDVYKVEWPDGWYTFYLLPYNEYIAVPNVYAFLDGGRLELVWYAMP